MFELDSIERELEVGIVAPPARRLRHIIDFFQQQIMDMNSQAEVYRNELASKRYKRDHPRNAVVTRGWEGHTKPDES
jgi:hypothetical protein